MKSTLYIGIASVALLAASSLQAQNNVQEEKEYWNAHTLLILLLSNTQHVLSR